MDFTVIALFLASVLGGSLIPVSYTHLDVYKRQIVSTQSSIVVNDPIQRD